jgi:hypothetical protein
VHHDVGGLRDLQRHLEAFAFGRMRGSGGWGG